MSRKLLLQVISVCVVLILVLVILYSGLQILESTIFSQAQYQSQMQTTSKTIIRDGVKYYPRQDITTLLLMGINQEGKVEKTPYNQGIAVDMAMLLIFDEATETCTVLSLNRDMMVDMPMLNEYGREVGVFNAQLAYSHIYGDGMEDSCENVRKTVSNLLYGVSIDYYLSLNMDAIALLNDAVGGVTVTVVDDFSAVDPEIPMGEVTLYGMHAVRFVQARWYVGDQLNLSRMERHKAYMTSFISALKQKIEEQPGFVVEAYESVSDYIVTDCSVQVLGRLEQDYGDYTLGETLSIPGENILGEEYYEFYADEEALDELILQLFYAPK